MNFFEMVINTLKEKALPFLKTYWLSIILIFCSWFIVKQFYMTIEYNILLAVSYKHVFGFSMIYFVMDNLTLIIHEAGHTIFGIFGWRFLTVLGGTLLQILIPFLLTLYKTWGIYYPPFQSTNIEAIKCPYAFCASS